MQTERRTSSIICEEGVKKAWHVLIMKIGNKAAEIIEKLLMKFITEPDNIILQVKQFEFRTKKKLSFKCDEKIWLAFKEKCRKMKIKYSPCLTYLIKDYLKNEVSDEIGDIDESEIIKYYESRHEIDNLLKRMKDDISFTMRHATSFHGQMTLLILEEKLKELNVKGIESKKLQDIFNRIDERGVYECERDLIKDWTPFPRMCKEYFFTVVEVEHYKETHQWVVQEHPEYFEKGWILERDWMNEDREKRRKKREAQHAKCEEYREKQKRIKMKKE